MPDTTRRLRTTNPFVCVRVCIVTVKILDISQSHSRHLHAIHGNVLLTLPSVSHNSQGMHTRSIELTGGRLECDASVAIFG